MGHLLVSICLSLQIFPIASRILTLKMAVETEIKFRINDLVDLAERLTAAGFHLETPRSFESNILYDTPSRTLRIPH